MIFDAMSLPLMDFRKASDLSIRFSYSPPFGTRVTIGKLEFGHRDLRLVEFLVSFIGGTMDSDEKRIAKALGSRKVPDVDEANLAKYKTFLLNRLDKQTILTGREDFPWEERYVFGYGSPAEYERLKKDNPSYKDDYKLIEILEGDVEGLDLVAHVERLSDTKRFQIGLSWLTTKDELSKDFEPLEDYFTWIANWS